MMKDRGLSEFKSFSGILQAGAHAASIIFCVRINQSGEVEFDFAPISLTQETKFINHCLDSQESKPGYFALSGKAEDGTEFKTEALYFNSLGNGCGDDGSSCMNLNGGCLRAEFRRKLVEPVQKLQLRMHVKGFQNFNQLSSTCHLGTITMDGVTTIGDPDIITGRIVVQSDNFPADLSVWRAEADKLLWHVQRMMSFASATVLRAPVIEFYAGDDLEVVTLSQSRQAAAHMPTFHFLDQQPIFETAVTNFSTPPLVVKNLFFAIEWFAMDATYNEVRLVNAMTVLENLVASNLGDDEVLIRPSKEFDKTRRKLRMVIKACIAKWSPDEDERAKEALEELNEKLGDLNRRSIRRKFDILVKRWNVPLDGIGEDKIKAVISARNKIVHEGSYDGGDDLGEHVAVAREIVVRFLLTAIGYQGRYVSYLGGYHHAKFPPQ